MTKRNKINLKFRFTPRNEAALYPMRSCPIPDMRVWSSVSRVNKNKSFFNFLRKFVRKSGIFAEMGKEKAGPLTPKAISNRIKAKGLQKLRWYCQMCQKQCRDEVRNSDKSIWICHISIFVDIFKSRILAICEAEDLFDFLSFQNGFKCHCMSESHQRQLLLFADNPNQFIDSFSK